MPLPTYIGGTFAPPLSDANLAEYRTILSVLPLSPIKDACAVLLACVEKWWGLPESQLKKQPHGSGRGVVVALEDEHQKTLWDLIPWKHELAAIQSLFDGIPVAEKELRDMAFHLLWHVKELDLDREPCTNDKLEEQP